MAPLHPCPPTRRRTGTRRFVSARAPFAALVLSALLLGACGGGSGQGLPTASGPVRVTSTSLPATKSGETIDHVIPLSGGCGGPYVITVIDGRLPRGVTIDDADHALRGVLLEDGQFAFTLQVVDTGCDPFSSTTASFLMGVDVGSVVIVDVLLDGQPSLAPPGSTPDNPVYAAFPTVVYNQFTTLELVVAGGVGPWSVEVVDDPTNPLAGPLPLGTSVPPNSATITGAPVEVGPDGGPFVLALRARDTVGDTSLLTVQWRIDTPAIIIATETLSDGVCGSTYSDGVFVAEGVPPFEHELVERGLPDDFVAAIAPDSGDMVYNPGAPPTVTPPEALDKIDAAAYPDPAALGPDYTASHAGAPPEGIRFDESTGSFTGFARRRGTFRIHYHVQSTLVPDSFGQHNWRSFTFQFQEAPPIQHDPSYTLEGAFRPAPPYTNLPPAEKKQPYNPDSAEEPLAGLQLLALGGARFGVR